MAQRYYDDEAGHDWGAIALGVVTGVGVGALLGVLFAPKAGRELRGDLREKAEETLDNLRDASAELSARARQLASHTRENVAESIQAGKAAYERTRDEMLAELDS